MAMLSLGLDLVITNEPRKVTILDQVVLLTNFLTFHAFVLWGEPSIVILDIHVSTCTIGPIELGFRKVHESFC